MKDELREKDIRLRGKDDQLRSLERRVRELEAKMEKDGEGLCNCWGGYLANLIGVNGGLPASRIQGWKRA